jgi:uncharacterized heparinase superfamily protein
MNAGGPIDAADGIEPGKRLIRVGGDQGASLAERLANHLHWLAWRTPFHALRLRGRYPLKLLAVPVDPIPGDARIGAAMLSGMLEYRGEAVAIATLAYPGAIPSGAFSDYVQSFAWLRDLAMAGDRARTAPVAERMVRDWLSSYGASVTAAAWRPDLCARRIMFWAAYAPLILSSTDLVYRSAVLNGLARAARHLDRGADKAAPGLPRVIAWCGVIAAGLLIPGGELRRQHGEAGLARALATATSSDGGPLDRSPLSLIALIEHLGQLRHIYDARRIDPCEALTGALARAVPALLGIMMGDGDISSWQGAGPVGVARIDAAVAASGVRARPLRQPRDWGYQRLASAQTRVVFDAAPPPVTRLAAGGCASTLAFELSDGPHRLIVNCGGGRTGAAGFPDGLAEALRATAAHSTLVIADSNSTATLGDGSLGRGVVEVELDRQEIEAGSRVEASHDGYVRRHGLIHRRTLLLTADGRELRGDDVLLPSGRRRRSQPAPVAVRFHLAPGCEITPTADGQGALIRIAGGALWQFRCRGGALSNEESLWVDAEGWPRPTRQLVISAEAPAGGASLSWLLKRAG